MSTRRFFLTRLAVLAPCGLASAQPQRTPDNPLRLGADQALLDGGLPQRLQRAFAFDTGIPIRLIAGASSGLLEALERGELDATLTHAPELEARLQQQGLAHDNRTVAQTDFVIAGPLRAGLARSRDATHTLAQIAQQAVPFLTRNDGSGTHLAEQRLWRAAGVAPVAPWYLPYDQNAGSLRRQAQTRGACVLIDRASLLSGGHLTRTWGVLVEGDPRLVTRIQWLRGFRWQHPASKLFAQWVVRRRGRVVVGGIPGYRAPD